MDAEEVVKLIERTDIAQNAKGYKFACATSRKCRSCANELVAFVTTDLDAAYQHSLSNNAPMWIAKD